MQAGVVSHRRGTSRGSTLVEMGLKQAATTINDQLADGFMGKFDGFYGKLWLNMPTMGGI